MNPFITQDDGDKITAAYHEAGHVVVAYALGCRPVTAELYENNNGGGGELHWVGRTGIGPASQDAEAAIGWAGKAAELIRSKSEFAEWWYDQIDEMSPSDRAMVEARKNWTRDCTQAVDILKSYWPEVERIALALITEEELSDLEIFTLMHGEGSPDSKAKAAVQEIKRLSEDLAAEKITPAEAKRRLKLADKKLSEVSQQLREQIAAKLSATSHTDQKGSPEA